MATLLLKKSYLIKDLKEIKFKDLWNDHGVFTTMRVMGKDKKILFKIIKNSLSKNTNYNHLLRVAINKKIISISLRKRNKPKLNFKLKLLNYKRIDPSHKNLKYKKILSYLKKLDNTEYDIALHKNKKFLETGTSNLLFIKNNRVYSPKNNFYSGITFKFFCKKIKINLRDIYLKNINSFDEILLIGSGKAVTSVFRIDELKWKRKSLNFFNKFNKIYQKKINYA